MAAPELAHWHSTAAAHGGVDCALHVLIGSLHPSGEGHLRVSQHKRAGRRLHHQRPGEMSHLWLGLSIADAERGWRSCLRFLPGHADGMHASAARHAHLRLAGLHALHPPLLDTPCRRWPSCATKRCSRTRQLLVPPLRCVPGCNCWPHDCPALGRRST